MEFFVRPGTDEDWHERWIETRLAWYPDLGVTKENLRLYEHPAEKRSHYSKRTVDIEYRYRLHRHRVGRARGHRQPHRLRPRHARQGLRPGPVLPRRRSPASGTSPTSSSPRPGVDRAMLAFLLDALRRGRGAGRQGQAGEADRAAAGPRGSPRSRWPCCRCPATPTCRPRPVTSPPCCASTGTPTSTTPARSAAATAARTRSRCAEVAVWSWRPRPGASGCAGSRSAPSRSIWAGPASPERDPARPNSSTTRGGSNCRSARSTIRSCIRRRAVNMGNPHAVFFVDEIPAYDLDADRPDAGEPPGVSGAGQYLRSPR